MDAVHVSDVNFQYSDKKVLTNINLQVPYGKIYSLLGPSGAGKTTLLRIILGRLKPNSGEVSVLSAKPGTLNRYIGYMPQDKALCMTFTVGQTLKYFANIYRLTKEEYYGRKANLRKLLNLPADKCLVSELSGGQQKILSLCITLIQDPKLMILDEPTVGSDPLLGDRIWNHLHSLCKEKNITVILVTHYIEEAARAQMTGIMRNGRILEEGSPEQLIKQYGVQTLEEVFLQLCMTDIEDEDEQKKDEQQIQQPTTPRIQRENSKVEWEKPEKIQQMKENMETKLSFWANLRINLAILMVLTQKNLSQFIRNKITFVGFLVPAFQVWILSAIFAADSVPIPIGVYNGEASIDYSGRVLGMIQKIHGYFIHPVQYESLETTLEALDHRKVYGVITFSENFTDSLWTRYVEADYMDDPTLNNSNIKLYLDNTDYVFSTAFLDTFRQTVFNFVNRMHGEENLTQLDPPIAIKEIVYGENIKLADYLLPGFMVSFIYMCQSAICSQALVQERQEGLFERSLVAGVTHSIILLSHFFSNFVISIFQVLLMFVVAFVIYNLTNFGHTLLIFTLVLAQALAAVATGLLISTIVDTGSSGLIISMGISFTQIFSSGTIFPKEMIPAAISQFVYLTPIGLPSESLRNAMLKAWPLTHPYVFNGFLVNIMSVFILLFIACIIFKKRS